MPAWAASTDLKPSQIFAADSPSIVVVMAYGQDGKAIAQGSGVVIAKDTVVSNCHVIEKADTAGVLYQSKHFSATLHYAGSERDLCSFTIKGLTAPPVQLGSTSQVKVGDAAYAIGAPEGLELTLSGGLISSLRKIPGGTVLQMTTPISPGSSGGGLFDSEGRLIGITSYYIKGGEQLNFALPVEWVRELPRHGKLAGSNTERVAPTVHAAQKSGLQDGVRAWAAGDNPVALAILKPLAIHGNAVAQFFVGGMYEFGSGVPQDYAQAVAWYRKAAAQGNVLAQSSLGSMYEFGSGVPQDYAQAWAWYHKAAAQGYALAQFALGTMCENGHGVPQDYAKAVAWYSKAAVQENAGAQYKLGVMYENGLGVAQDYAQAVAWYRKAAVQDTVVDTMAQYNLGVMYAKGQGVPQDYVAAYALFNFSASLDRFGDNQATTYRSTLINLMTPEQVTAGQALTREMQRIGVLKALDEYLNGGAK